jgi:glycosyltransferase involved in cell wall biosynthesis
MRVLHVFNSLRYSGAELLLASAAELLLKAGDHTILSTGDHVGEYADTLASKGFSITHTPFKRTPAYFLSFLNLVRRGGFDIVHIHCERAAFWYAVAARLANAGVLRSIHSKFYFTGNLRVRRGVQRQLMRMSGVRLVACSANVAENEAERFRIAPLVIENWIDPKRISPSTLGSRESARELLGIPSDQFAILTLGNHSPIKNHESVIQAVAACAPGLDVHYYHCGHSDEALQRSTPPGIMERVHFKGPQSDIAPWMSACDALVTASYAEGGPLSLLEGAAAGIPNITTRVGLAHVFEGMPSFSFIEPTAASIAAAIQKIAQVSITDRSRIGDAARELVCSRFVPGVGAPKYIQIYQELSHGIRR